MAMDVVRLKVQSVTAETPLVRRVVMAPQTGSLPPWEAGAHVRVRIPDGSTRPYSLLALPHLGADRWALGVLLEAEGTGGSRFMHALKVGDEVMASTPSNNFRLHDSAHEAALFAGGIGVTPILSMAAALNARGGTYRAFYAGRTLSNMAFVSEMTSICGARLSLHDDSDVTRLDLASAMGRVAQGAHIYVCGPSGMIDAVKRTARERGFQSEQIHFELFAGEPSPTSNQPFEVEIRSTGQIIPVAADQTIIQALEQAGLSPLYDCQRGDCGICQCGVIAGVPDHRDVILTDNERSSNKVMQICVSRAKSERLVLDL